MAGTAHLAPIVVSMEELLHRSPEEPGERDRERQ
jgi:hypothetical protein